MSFFIFAGNFRLTYCNPLFSKKFVCYIKQGKINISHRPPAAHFHQLTYHASLFFIVILHKNHANICSKTQRKEISRLNFTPILWFITHPPQHLSPRPHRLPASAVPQPSEPSCSLVLLSLPAYSNRDSDLA